MQDFFLKTDRLTMRIPTTHSLSNWYALQSDLDVIKYLGDVKPRDKLEIEKNLRETILHFNKYNFSFFDVYKDDIFIGVAGLVHLEFNEVNEDIEIGYVLHKKFWGKGYATELAKKIIHYGLYEIKLKRLIACCHIDNVASSKVMLKCGMTYSKKYKYKGLYDCDLYQI
jgi:RimJ/RimL family protein N-acetyltransferase